MCVSLDVWGEFCLKVAGLVQTRTTVRLQYDTYVFSVQVYVQYLGWIMSLCYSQKNARGMDVYFELTEIW